MNRIGLNISEIDMVINNEVQWAIKHYPKFKSKHEGIAIIREEFEELWDEIKKSKPSNPNNEAIKKEAVQLAAMCKRFLMDVC